MSGKYKECQFYIVYLAYATFGIEINRAYKAVKTAPIAKWMVGKTLQQIKDWVIKKQGKIVKIG